MSDIIFTKEEKEKMKKAMNFVIEDIRDLWKESNYKKLVISTYIRTKGYGWWEFVITDNSMYLFRKTTSETISIEKKLLGGRTIITKDEGLCYTFLNYYSILRRDLESRIKEGVNAKNNGFAGIDDIIKKYQKEATIEIEVPNSKNSHTINIKKENGQSIGEIDFGFSTIRLITKGDIVLKNEFNNQENIKTK